MYQNIVGFSKYFIPESKRSKDLSQHIQDKRCSRKMHVNTEKLKTIGKEKTT